MNAGLGQNEFWFILAHVAAMLRNALRGIREGQDSIVLLDENEATNSERDEDFMARLFDEGYELMLDWVWHEIRTLAIIIKNNCPSLLEQCGHSRSSASYSQNLNPSLGGNASNP